MIRLRPVLKPLALCAALLGLMAVTAGSAESESTASWTVVSNTGVFNQSDE